MTIGLGFGYSCNPHFHLNYSLLRRVSNVRMIYVAAIETIDGPDGFSTDSVIYNEGGIYFRVKNDEDILQSLTSEDTFVQVIIGLDTTEMVSEMELIGQAESDFDLEEIEDEDNRADEDDNDDEDDDDDDEDEDDESDGYENEWVSLLEEGEDDEDPGDWAKLETMRSSHPMMRIPTFTQEWQKRLKQSVELAATVSERLEGKGVVQAISVESTILPTAPPGNREAALKKLKIKSDHEKELAEITALINAKYEVKNQDAEAAFQSRMKEIESYVNRVFMIYRSKDCH